MSDITKLRAAWIANKPQAIGLIVEKLNANNGDVTATAKALGASKNTLFRMIQESPELRLALDTIRGAAGWQKMNGRCYPPAKE